MGVGEPLRPSLSHLREIGQPVVLSSRSPGTFFRKEGGYERHNATWSVRPAEARAGCPSVVLAGSSLAVPHRHLILKGIACQQVSEESSAVRGTQAPGINELSPDGKSSTPDFARVLWAARMNPSTIEAS